MTLDLQQSAAIISPHQNTLVVAGAGSGKTTVLVERVDYLVKNKRVSPYDILCLTFTRKAAGEMRSRLSEKMARADALNIGTFHAMALQILRQWGAPLGIRPDTMTIFSEWESEQLARDTAKLIGAKPGFNSALEEFYRTGKHPEKYSPHARFLDVFLSRLRSFNALTYGMLLNGWQQVMTQWMTHHPIAHVLVDEVQDLDPVQWGLLHQMQAIRPKLSIFCVGDQDQSIYAFRGAIPERMSGAASTGFQVYKLESNYRSLPEIIERSNSLIDHNKERIPKIMRATRKDKEPTKAKVWTIRNMDSGKMAAMLADLVASGEKNIAVLARVHVLLIKLSQELNERKVDHTYCADRSNVIRSEEFRRVHALMKLAINRHDNFSFMLARQYLGCTDADYQEVLRLAYENQKPQLSNWMDMNARANETWGRWFLTARDQSLQEAMTRLVDCNLSLETAMACRIAVEFAGNSTKIKLVNFLDWITTFDLQEDVSDPDEGGVQLMTIHQAKGLEWDTVVLAGWNDGILPDKRAVTDHEIEEERRLAYVAMTRARENLIICVRPEVSESHGKTYRNPASRFLNELSVLQEVAQ